jgi:hypothetical protein
MFKVRITRSLSVKNRRPIYEGGFDTEATLALLKTAPQRATAS